MADNTQTFNAESFLAGKAGNTGGGTAPAQQYGTFQMPQQDLAGFFKSQGYGTFQPPQQQDWMKTFGSQGFGSFSYKPDASLNGNLNFSNLYNYAQSVPKAVIDGSNSLASLQGLINDTVNGNQISGNTANEIMKELQSVKKQLADQKRSSSRSYSQYEQHGGGDGPGL